jgi:hypothetical protein
MGANLAVMATYGNARCSRTMSADPICGPGYGDIPPAGGLIYVRETPFSGLLHAYYSPGGDHDSFENSIALWMQRKHRTFLGASGIAYRFYEEVGTSDYLMSHFANEALRDSTQTVGEAYLHAWDSYWVSGGAESPQARSASYAMILWGLPTQPLQHRLAPLRGAVTARNAPAAPTALARSFTVAVSVPNFRFDYDAAGAALVSPANGGGTCAPDAGWPLLPQVMYHFVLPAGATDVQVVENTAARVSQDAGAVPLRTARVTADCDENCLPPESVPPVVLTAAYPTDSFDVGIRSISGITPLTLRVLPAQYTPDGQLTLFTHMEFTVSYNLPAAPAAALTGLTVNGGAPVQAGMASVPLAVDVTSDVARAVTLSYSMEGPNGYVLDSGIAAADLPAGASQVSLTLDAGQWTPGPNLLMVQLGTDSGTLDTASAAVLVLGLRLAAEPASQLVPLDATVPLTVRAWDEEGAPVSGLAAGIVVQLDGAVHPLTFVEGPAGTYQAALDTAGLALGRHELGFTAADSRGLHAEAWVGFTTVQQIFLPLVMHNQ